MNKKLIAVAVAGAFAAPAAFAQSSVTISGTLKGGFEGLNYGNYGNTGAGRAAGTNRSTTGVTDDSSAVVFTILEDLGGGLQAEGRVDMRATLDGGGGSNNATSTALGNMGASGNTHLGLKSKSWGTVFFGRQDLHYFNTESDLTSKGSLRASSIAILSYVTNTVGARSAPIANATRTGNVVFYKTPDFGPFWMIVAYSSNPAGAGGNEADIANFGRKGRAWNLNPNFSGANWQIGYSYWTSKQDGVITSAAPAAGVVTSTSLTGDQRGDRLYGSYTFPMGFKIGLAWDKSRVRDAGIGTTINNRNAWSIPMSYTWGNHSVHAHFDRAQRDRAARFAGLDTRANMFAISYAYDLSKRTSAAITYARVNNSAAANYNVFASTSLGLSNQDALGAQPGEDPRIWAVTMRHAF